jgi:hypothetical protein
MWYSGESSGALTRLRVVEVTAVRGTTLRVSQTLPPMTLPSPITVSPPKIVAPA